MDPQLQLPIRPGRELMDPQLQLPIRPGRD
jgi:hypothetical protein